MAKAPTEWRGSHVQDHRGGRTKRFGLPVLGLGFIGGLQWGTVGAFGAGKSEGLVLKDHSGYGVRLVWRGSTAGGR